jgi:hypothetical protein
MLLFLQVSVPQSENKQHSGGQNVDILYLLEFYSVFLSRIFITLTWTRHVTLFKRHVALLVAVAGLHEQHPDSVNNILTRVIEYE